LNTAYGKVSDQIKSDQLAIKKDFDDILKLNVLKGMLMEETVKSKDLKPWVKYMSKNRNLFPRKHFTK